MKRIRQKIVPGEEIENRRQRQTLQTSGDATKARGANRGIRRIRGKEPGCGQSVPRVCFVFRGRGCFCMLKAL